MAPATASLTFKTVPSLFLKNTFYLASLFFQKFDSEKRTVFVQNEVF